MKLRARKFLSARKISLNGFTLIEILIVVSIIAILAGALLLANVNSSFQRTRDSKRKQDLNKLMRVLEDYYNDHNEYPPANDPRETGQIKDAPWGSKFDDYAANLPGDPLSPQIDYFYQAGNGGKFYVIYTKLETTSDPDIERVGCQQGCGPVDASGSRVFNFFVSSGDVMMAAGIPNGEDPGVIKGVPTLTPTRSSGITPTPTLNLTPPASPNGICSDNQCCLNHWCGAASTEEGGKYCVQMEKCHWNDFYRYWQCSCATQPCNDPDPACP